jgi:hypothetical protein
VLDACVASDERQGRLPGNKFALLEEIRYRSEQQEGAAKWWTWSGSNPSL